MPALSVILTPRQPQETVPLTVIGRSTTANSGWCVRITFHPLLTQPIVGHQARTPLFTHDLQAAVADLRHHQKEQKAQFEKRLREFEKALGEQKVGGKE